MFYIIIFEVFSITLKIVLKHLYNYIKTFNTSIDKLDYVAIKIKTESSIQSFNLNIHNKNEL